MNKPKYIILGGGMVAGYAAKELVDRGLKPGELTIVSADSTVPYERPPLSKGFLSGKDSVSGILINPPDWYREHGIDVKLNALSRARAVSSISRKRCASFGKITESIACSAKVARRYTDTCPGR